MLEQVLETYPRDVAVVYKNYPLRGHRFALAAAAAALAAEKQGQFWEFRDLLFLNGRELNLQKIMDIARDLSIDERQLFMDMNDHGVLKAIERDIQEGNRIGISGTPTVFVNDMVLTNRSFAGFQAVIDAVLEHTDGALSMVDAPGRHRGSTIANKENNP